MKVKQLENQPTTNITTNDGDKENIPIEVCSERDVTTTSSMPQAK